MVVILTRAEVLRLDKRERGEIGLLARSVGKELAYCRIVRQILPGPLLSQHQGARKVVVIDPPRHSPLGHSAKNRRLSLLCIPMQLQHFSTRRHSLLPQTRTRKRKEAIRPRGPEHGRKPSVANSKLPAKRVQRRQKVERVIAHYVL